MSEQLTFPQGFMWGVAGAGHQIEGNNVNSDSWLLEHVPGTTFSEPSGDACDHYHRYPDDIAMVAALGFNSYRFSLEWARIEPEEGEFSTAALEHYRRMLVVCHENHLTPIVTYNHFTCPRWFGVKGGWEVSANAEYFARFCERATAHLGDLIGVACTLNEPNLGIMLQSIGVFPSDETVAKAPYRLAAARAVGSDTFSSFPTCCQQLPVRDTLIKAHRLGYNAIKSGRGDFPVGITLAMFDHQAVEGGEALCDQIRQQVDDVFLDAVRNDDFIGVQNYTRMRYGSKGILPPEAGVELTQVHYEYWPEALEATIRYAANYTGRPILVTENGVATVDDSKRIEFVRRALMGVERCVQDGIAVKGYCYWSVFDNFEWGMGFQPTFGLIAVDLATQVRTPKPSAAWLGNVARTNAL
ncbi:MAG: family 1 glycosylhydrolase [Anaerolineaceae bacterium]|nr:family 1 glycosylhydrolase [Anaerolineaceae bacterium]